MKNNTEIFNTAKEIISFVSTFIFIVFSLILYFVPNNRYFFIPLILYTANLFMLIEMSFIFKKNIDIKIYFPKIDSRRSKLVEMGYLNLNEEVGKYFNQKKIDK